MGEKLRNFVGMTITSKTSEIGDYRTNKQKKHLLEMSCRWLRQKYENQGFRVKGVSNPLHKFTYTVGRGCFDLLNRYEKKLTSTSFKFPLQFAHPKGNVK